jgi:fumarylacetoacetase
MTDETHDPTLRSWVESANAPGCDFPIQNLPLCVFRTIDDPRARIGVGIGDSVLDASEWVAASTLNSYFDLPRTDRQGLRKEFSRALRAGAPALPLRPQSECELLLPAQIGDYTDFYASIDHAMNVGRMFRPDNPLLPNYRHIPIAYHGRSSSIIVSGAPITRPRGQLAKGVFGPTRELDYELELGAWIGPGNTMGRPIGIGYAPDHIAGVCLLNDWSARDIQRWEYQPLGPFLGKNFATSISPWVVTIEALEPFRRKPAEHEEPVLPYLASADAGAFDITLEVFLKTNGMAEPERVSRSSFSTLYWTLDQMLVHHTSNGCPMRSGDLMASGTISGPLKENRGCLLELTWKGEQPLVLSNAEKRTFLEDGDEVILTGYCEAPGFRRIGLGTCSGTIVSAVS